MNNNSNFINQPQMDKSYKKHTIDLNDDMTFTKASEDPKLIQLQKDLTELITSIIIKHEMELCTFIDTNFPDSSDILTTNNNTIPLLINEVNNKFFQKVNLLEPTHLTNLITTMAAIIDCEPSAFITKLKSITENIHLQIARTQLSRVDNDTYTHTLLNQLNLIFSTINFLHLLLN